jgi:hypothetical protein
LSNAVAPGVAFILNYHRAFIEWAAFVSYLELSGAEKGSGMSISRLIVTACLAGAMLAGAPALAEDGKRPDKVSFYFAAHEDDWQLFMNPSAFQDVIGGAAKTVFVHLTAGDAGLGIGLGGRKHPFYLAR